MKVLDEVKRLLRNSLSDVLSIAPNKDFNNINDTNPVSNTMLIHK